MFLLFSLLYLCKNNYSKLFYMVNNKTILYFLLAIVFYYIITRFIFVYNPLVSNVEQFTSTSNVSTNKLDAFCNTNIGNSNNLTNSCSQLTTDNCKSTSCCVWTSNNQCVAGDANGTTFNTKNGKTNKLDYYFFENECYGEKCKSL